MNIAIVFDEGIFFHHHGVRCLAITIYNEYLKCHKNIDLLLHDNQDNYKIIDAKIIDIQNGFFSGEKLIGKSRSEIISKLDRILLNEISTSASINIDFKKLNYLDQNKKYELVIFSGPWLIKPKMNFPKSNSYKVLAHDVVPIDYFFMDPDNYDLKLFANAHHIGYQWAATKGDGFLVNSQNTFNDLEKLNYINHKSRGDVLPITLPPGFDKINDDEIKKQKRKNTAILMAPFDKRKGLEFLSKILRNSYISKLNIIGRNRAEIKMVTTFFKDIDIENISWWTNATFETKKKLYLESKILLFPSLNEGLGIPIIEAYASGCRCLGFDHLSSKLLLEEDKMKNVEDFKKQLTENKLKTLNPIKYRRHIESICGESNFYG